MSDTLSAELTSSVGSESCISQHEQAFLNAVAGVDVLTPGASTVQQRTYLEHVRQQIDSIGSKELGTLINAHSNANSEQIVDSVFALLARLAYCARTQSHFSIDKAILMASEGENKLIAFDALRDGPLRDKARILVYSCLSWISMLYSPLLLEGHPDIALPEHVRWPYSGADVAANADRPICELIQNFGHNLPGSNKQMNIPNLHDGNFSAESLYVSLLNAKTLTQIGGITIEWVDNISSHLLLDTESSRLMLFRLPSFCHVNLTENTAFSKYHPRSSLAPSRSDSDRLISEYHDDFSKPAHFTGASFLKEVRLSYRLIFADDSSARRLFHSKEKKRAGQGMPPDPYLNELCRKRKTSAANERNSYSKVTDFPIFAERLSILQEYIQRQSPKSLAMIWRDRRNPSQW